mgnify:CR=1 FL=1
MINIRFEEREKIGFRTGAWGPVAGAMEREAETIEKRGEEMRTSTKG